jgi:hypothetical protein
VPGLIDLRKRIDRPEIDHIFLIMRTLMELQKEITALGEEERSGLASFILSSLPNAPSGPDDEEVAKRENEMDSGEATPISYTEFKQAVGR